MHPKLGEFIEKVLKVAHVNLSKMCQEIHMGPATYQKVKKGKKKRNCLWNGFLACSMKSASNMEIRTILLKISEKMHFCFQS